MAETIKGGSASANAPTVMVKNNILNKDGKLDIDNNKNKKEK